MIIDTWVLIAAGLAIAISLGIGIGASGRCSTLELDVDQLRHYSSKQEDIIVSLKKRVQSLEEDIEKVKGEHQVNITSISKMLSETDRKTDNYYRSIEKRMKELYDIVRKNNPVDTTNPESIDTESVEAPVYRWIFPAEEPDHEKQLINGQSYIAIGVLKNPETMGITTREGFWNGHKFLILTKDSYDEFDTVYAYIRKPESADVMEKVVQMALANKG